VTVLLAVVLLGVAAAGTATVLTRDPLDQAVVASFFGLLLGVAFLVLQAPDVALSQVTVGAVALPLMILLALAKIRRQAGTRAEAGSSEPGERG
jgi:energy-converting hydrogenase B subunit D